jgi:hypothetical protein
MKVNAGKTETLVVNPHEPGDDSGYLLGNVPLKAVSVFKYLGCRFNCEASGDLEFDERIRLASIRMRELSGIWRQKSLSRQLKVRLVQALVFPILTYGCEAWVLYKDQRARLAAFETKAYRRVMNISYRLRSRNTSVFTKAGTGPVLLKQIALRKLNYFGHVMRHPSLEKCVIAGEVAGTRRQGGQKREWFYEIEEWLGEKLPLCIELAQDRLAFARRARAAAEKSAGLRAGTTANE